MSGSICCELKPLKLVMMSLWRAHLPNNTKNTRAISALSHYMNYICKWLLKTIVRTEISELKKMTLQKLMAWGKHKKSDGCSTS